MRMWHGTDAHNAGRIAIEGLVRDPEWRHYAVDGESAHLASLPGAYVTASLASAVGYAHKVALEWAGSLAVVEIEVDPAKMVPDEDIVTLALEKALRQARSPAAFAESLHADLTMAVDVPARHDLLVALGKAYGPFMESEGHEGAGEYRAALEAVCDAYAETAALPHPVYLGGKHSARAPAGIPPGRVVSVTVFDLDFGDGHAAVADPVALRGEAMPGWMLEEAAGLLEADGFFGGCPEEWAEPSAGP